jgi:hypothetical protein
MAFPTTSSNTANLAAGTNSPALSRVDLYNALVLLNEIIASANQASGTCVLNGFGKIDSSMVPNFIQTTGELSLEPSTEIVTIKYVQRLVPQTTAQLEAMTEPFILGDIAIVSDADAGDPAICFYDGTEWKILPFGDMAAL